VLDKLFSFVPHALALLWCVPSPGECKELECPFKHSLDDVKECNMYKLGFCIYGPNCRYKHTKQPGETSAAAVLQFNLVTSLCWFELLGLLHLRANCRY
jgi:hypothetical protein